MSLPWGFFFAGARNVVASLWQVDDEATTLLMARFYENMLGLFESPRRLGEEEHPARKPMAIEPALREARDWLRSLTAKEAEEAKTKLEGLVAEGEALHAESKAVASAEAKPDAKATSRGAKALVPEPKARPDGRKPGIEPRPTEAERPYAHPYFWGAFVCVGPGE